jgi:predicted MFS family arabinose efflux permease
VRVRAPGSERAARAKGGSPLRQPALRRLITAELISRLGSQLSGLALPWFVLISTGSATRMGVVYAVELAPIVLLGIPSGIVVARIGVRRTMFLGEGFSAVIFALIPLLHVAGLLPFWMLLVLVGLSGVVAAPFLAAQRLLLPEVLGDDTAAVSSANALLESATRAAALVGPALTGVLIAVIGGLNVLWIDAASYVVSFALLIGLPRRRAEVSEEARAPGGLIAGAKYLVKDRIVSRVVVAAVGYGAMFPFVMITLPILAKVRYGADPRVAGLLLAAWGGGAMIGALGAMRLVRKLPPMRVGAVAGVAIAVPLWFLPLDQPAATVALIMVIVGVIASFLNSPLVGVLSTRPPEAVRPQVVTFSVTANFLAAPAAYAVAGTLIGHFGISHVQLATAAGVTLCGLLLVSLVRYEPAPAVTPPASVPAQEES